MKSLVADLIADFERRGGKIVRCPDGNALAPLMPIRRKGGSSFSALMHMGAVGNVKKQARRIQSNQKKILTALKMAAAPLSYLELEATTKLPLTSLRKPLETLEAKGQIASACGRRRTFWIVLPGTGESAGGPASASAVGACADMLQTSAARTGRKAA